MTPRSSERPVRIMMEVAEGRVASAILNNGFLGHCVRMGATVDLFTPGAVFPPFVKRYQMDGVTIRPLSFDTPIKGHGKLFGYERRIARKLTRRGYRNARRWLWYKIGVRTAETAGEHLASLVNLHQPDVFFTPDLYLGFGRGFIGACWRKGVPTIGNIFSWDHPYHEHPSRADRLTCWSPMAKEALVQNLAYLPDQIDVIGAPAYDPYVDPNNAWSRERLCATMGLDPHRPIIVFATLGQLRNLWDETDTCRALMSEIDSGRIPGHPQVILRMHPLSVGYTFSDIESRPDVVVSRYVGYSPGMRWWPSSNEVVLAANILRHANVCLSPGSTWAIEPSIFDTPTIVPVFNQYMPKEYDWFFNEFWMSRHFRFLADRKLLPFPRSPSEMGDAICRALAEPAWMRDERRIIREEIFGPLDGCSTERLAKVVLRTATNGTLLKQH